jgi:hypothetical protein
VATALAVGTWLLLAGTAWAHHANVTGTVDCGGTVTFQVTSWRGVQPRPGQPADLVGLSRTNGDVVLSYSIDGGPFRAAPTAPIVLDANDDYNVVGHFELPPLAKGLEQTVVLRARADAPWGDGVVDPGTQLSPLLIRRSCPSTDSKVRSGRGGATDRPAWVLGGGLVAAVAAGAVTSRRFGSGGRR